MELGLIRKVDIDNEMQQSYLDYAMSVIVSRALPDARDGLKPVQRRILYAMYELGLRQDSAYKKSARIVGEVLGKFHPHGDMAVYEAMARMAQDFSMRYMLVDGQGNFGSVDGDPPAAMRYTEARLTSAAIEMINQIDKDTVNFVPNFDDTLREPDVMPAALPNLLVNGATGIAVGMATNIPPHNLGEVVDALIYMLEHWEKLDDIPIDHLLRFIQGPDFPTGGVIIQDPQGDGLSSAYGTGRGKVIVQARAHLEEMVRGRNRIIVTELPYMTNKAALIERIAELVREGHLEGIADLRDESDRQGMRIVIELTKTADPEKILRDLYHRTPMQSTFGITLLALVDGEPRMLTLKQALKVYVEHRLTVVKRRSEFDLARARQRAHILEGLRIALQNLDEIIQLIRSSTDADQAKKRLMTRYKLSDVQAQAILDMPLRRLAALERKKIEQEYKEVVDLIKSLETLLRSPKKMRQVVIDELQTVRKAYADRRRTQIVRLKEGASIANLLTTTDVDPAQTVWVSVTQDGKIARSLDNSQPQKEGREIPLWTLRTNTHHTLYLVTETGRAAAIPVHAVPVFEHPADGPKVSKVCPLREDDPIAAAFALPTKGNGNLDGYLISVSRAGLVKKTALSELPGPSAQAFVLAKVNDGDQLGWVLLTHGEDELLLVSAEGLSIRFSENEVRPMGLVAAGVGGMKLAVGDELVSAMTLPARGEVALFASDGRAKRVPYKDFPVQGRFGQGAIAWKLGKGLRLVGGAAGMADLPVVLLLAKSSAKMIRLGDVTAGTRAGQGKSIVEVKPGDRLVAVSIPRDGENRSEPAPIQKPKRGKSTLTQPESILPAFEAAASAAALPASPNSDHSQPITSKIKEKKSGDQASRGTRQSKETREKASPVSLQPKRRGRSADASSTPVRRRSRDDVIGKRGTTSSDAQPGSPEPVEPVASLDKPKIRAARPALSSKKESAPEGGKVPRETKVSTVKKISPPSSSPKTPASSAVQKGAVKKSSTRAKTPAQTMAPAAGEKGRSPTRNKTALKAAEPAGLAALPAVPEPRKSRSAKGKTVPAAAQEKPGPKENSPKTGKRTPLPAEKPVDESEAAETVADSEKNAARSKRDKTAGTTQKTTPSSKGVAESKALPRETRNTKPEKTPKGKL